MELVTAIAAPVITGLVTLLGILAANRKQAAVKEAQDELREQALAEWRESVTARLDSHNEYAQLFHSTVAEQNVTLARIDERLKVLEQRRS